MKSKKNIFKTHFKNQRLINQPKTKFKTKLYDKKLVWCTLLLFMISLIMVTSASIPIAYNVYKDFFYFTKKEIYYLTITFILTKYCLNTPIYFWKKNSEILLLISIIMLLLVLFINHPINGSSRWIKIGFVNIQPAEITKLSIICYLSSYLSRKHYEIVNSFWGFCKPIIIVSVISILLLIEPDLGTVLIIFITTLSLLFISGAKLWKFLPISLISITIIVVLIITTPYRMKRMLIFLDPWKDPFGKGYQLTQSLMALGRGKIFGEGLGYSIQKLEYLPEAHTDFIFSIIGEELGYIGACTVLFMILFISLKALLIGKRSFKNKDIFSGYLASSIGIWLSLQTLINISTTISLLPTKGLTLPLISYGGSSLVITSLAISILLRIDFEIRSKQFQAFH